MSAFAKRDACHVCGGPLRFVGESGVLAGVTSDCRIWPGTVRPAVCHRCGVVQKVADAEWRSQTARIYGSYRLYHQYGGAEQRIFALPDGSSACRSETLMAYFKKRDPLSSRGDLLEIGCGPGVFLRLFGARYPGWRMSGMDTDLRCASKVRRIRRGVRFYRTLKQVCERYDRIVLIHTLEHIPDPVSLLKGLVARLKPGGKVLVQVPDLEKNPFDLAVADHVSHFTRTSLEGLFRMAGYGAVSVDPWIPKELTAMARPRIGSGDLRPSAAPAGSARTLGRSLRFLDRFLIKAKKVMRRRPYGVFGTSIAAAWLCSAAQQKPDFFVDESGGSGRRYLRRRVLPPTKVDPAARVVVPMPSRQAASVVRRLRSLGIRWVFCIPPGAAR